MAPQTLSSGMTIARHGSAGHRSFSWATPRGVHYAVTFDPRRGTVLLYERTARGRDRFAQEYPYAPGGPLPASLVRRIGPRAAARIHRAGAGRFDNPTDLDVRERFDRCVRDVTARGGVRSPAAICAASMRRAYGPQFQRIAAEGRSAAAAGRHARGEVRARATGRLARRPASRLRPTAVQRRGELGRVLREQATAKRVVERQLRAVANPTEEVLQSRRVGPGHTTYEWVHVARGRWVDQSAIAAEPRRPARRPGKHLVAPGAQLLVMQGERGPELMYARALFVRHHHHWRFLAPMSKPVRLQLARDGVRVPAGLAPGDARAVQHLVHHASRTGAHARG